MDSDLMRWVKAQADDPNANPRFRELLAALEAARGDAAEAKQNGYELGLLAAAREDGWQPIETAPKDGTWVLLAGGDIDYGWDDPSKPASVVGQWTADSECWQFAWYDGGFYGEYETPTHWRPLPAPPAIDQARGKGGQEAGNG